MNNFKSKIVSQSIAIVTTTLYPHWYKGNLKKDSTEEEKIQKTRGDLALEMLKAAKEKNFWIVLIDAGSSLEFLEQLTKIGIKSISAKDKALSPSRQQGFKLASKIKGVKVICWLEPEKVSIPKDSLPHAVLPILKNQSDIVIPKRDESAFATYPSYQAEIEKLANKKWNTILKKYKLLPQKADELDIWFGPKFFRNNPHLIKLFLRRYKFKSNRLSRKEYKFDEALDLDLWQNAIILPIISAVKEGYHVMSYPINFSYPAEQKKVENNSSLMRRKREIQYRGILLATEYFTRYITKRKKLDKIKLTRNY